jgi:long-chain acyl-CoA synthetase
MPAEGSPVRDVADLLTAAAGLRPDGVAVVEAAPGGRTVTWAELDDEVSRVAAGLGDSGVLGGSRVVLLLGNRLEMVVAYLAVLRLQAVAVPITPSSTAGEVARVVADAGARLVVAGGSAVGAAREALGGAEASPGPPAVLVVVGTPAGPRERSWDDLRAADPRPVPPLPDPEKPAALLYTSGTSGRPRAAVLTHRALLANVEQAAAVDPPLVAADDVVLGVLPLFHVYGLGAVLGGVLRHRARLVLVERFDPEGTLDVVCDHACTVLPVAPPVLRSWLHAERLGERLASVRLVLSGSAPLAPGLAERFTALSGLPVDQGYGLTEAAPVVTSTRVGGRRKPGSVGAALPGVEVRLVDATGRSPEGDDPGEIQVRGANLFSGYWPDGADGPDAEGWWPTGDLGYLDPDGDLHLVDRRGDLVIVSGFNVYPAEVEEVVAEVDGVEEVAVIGVDDPGAGEAVVAYVRGSRPGLADAVREHCAARLARFKQPARVEVVDELPTTATGKVRKGRLRQLERRRATGLLE